MNDWFLAGYFTMDLHVRRVCDAIMLPLGINNVIQIKPITIYGNRSSNSNMEESSF